MSHEEPSHNFIATADSLRRVVSQALYGGQNQDPKSVALFHDLQHQARIGLQDQLPDPDNFGYGVEGTSAYVATKEAPVELHFGMKGPNQRNPLELSAFGLPDIPAHDEFDATKPSFLVVARDQHEQISSIFCYTDRAIMAMKPSGQAVLIPERLTLTYQANEEGDRVLSWSNLDELSTAADSVGALLSLDNNARSPVASELVEAGMYKQGRRTVSVRIPDSTDFDGRAIVIRPESKDDEKIVPHKVAKAEKRLTRAARLRTASMGLLGLSGLAYAQADPPQKIPHPIAIEDFRGGESEAEIAANTSLRTFLEGDYIGLSNIASKNGSSAYIDPTVKDFESSDSLKEFEATVRKKFDGKIVVHSVSDGYKDKEGYTFEPINEDDLEAAEDRTREFLDVLSRVDSRLIEEPLHVYFGHKLETIYGDAGGWASVEDGIVIDVDSDLGTVAHETGHIIDQTDNESFSNSVESIVDGEEYVGVEDKAYVGVDVRNDANERIYLDSYSSASSHEDATNTLRPSLSSEGLPTFERSPLFDKYQAILTDMEDKAPGSSALLLKMLLLSNPDSNDIPDGVESNVTVAARATDTVIAPTAFTISKSIALLAASLELVSLVSVLGLRRKGGHASTGRKLTLGERLLK